MHMSAFDPKRTLAPFQYVGGTMAGPEPWGEANETALFHQRHGGFCSGHLVASRARATSGTSTPCRRAYAFAFERTRSSGASSGVFARNAGCGLGGWTQFTRRISLERGRYCASIERCERTGCAEPRRHFGRCRRDHAAPATSNRVVPIVFAQGVDPVGNQYVDSLSRPGGNITGFVQLNYD